MNKKLNCIMLIDDNESSNFFNRMILERIGCANEILDFEMATDAIEYLYECHSGSSVQPDLIFLDVNMPAMNGWEFLEAYRKLKSEGEPMPAIVMLTTSVNPDDKQRSETIPEVKGFLNKPLSKESVYGVLLSQFPNASDISAAMNRNPEI